MKKITYLNGFSRLTLLAMCFSLSTISFSYAASSNSDVLVYQVPSEKSDYTEKVLVDLETVRPDWSAGVGGFCFAGDVMSTTANPSIDAQNGSAHSLKWTRDASKGNAGGGYDIQFGTAQNCTGWDRFSFQIYSLSPITAITLTFKSGSTALGSKALTCNVLANQWTKITVNLSDIGMVGKTFSEFMVQPGSNSPVQIFDTYSDNFKFEAGTAIVVTPPVVTSNAIGDDAYPIANVIDGINTTDWRGATMPSTSNPVWLQIKYSSAKTFNNYTLTSNGSSSTSDPMTWVLEGSNDATTWTSLDAQSNITWTARKTAKTFVFSNTTAYSYYRMTATAINGGTTEIRLADIAFSSVTTGVSTAFSEKAKIYPQSDKVIVDLSTIKEASIITIFDVKGSVVKTVRSTGNEKVNISLKNKGIYLIRVQNSTILTQKVVF
ncbi:MAG: discoidin domain-containing protein [Bacteroidota bacterium]|nr:discoidin domain-containing protein [Bacteroidota bacterium]